MFKNWYANARYIWSPVLIVMLILGAGGVANATDFSVTELLRSGRIAFADGNYGKAEDDLRRAITEAGPGGTLDADTALAEGELGSLLLAENRNVEAEPLLDSAIAVLRTKGKGDQRQLRQVMINLGNLYRVTGRYSRSESIFKEALKLGPDADLYDAMGALHLQTRKFKQAEQDFKKALAMVDNRGNPNDPRFVPILANLASLYHNQQKWNLAIETLLRSLEIIEKGRGADHPDVAVLKSNLAVMYYEQGDFSRAEAMHRSALAIRGVTFGPDNTYTAQSAEYLAEVLEAEGKYGEAETLFASALDTQERVLGRRVPQVATTLERFAVLLRRTHDDVQAADMENRASAIRMESAYTVSVK